MSDTVPDRDPSAPAPTPGPTSVSLVPDRRQLLLGGLMLAAAGTAYARQPRERGFAIGKDQIEGSLPLTVGPWRYETKSGLVLPPPDELSQQLYDQVLTRVYTAAEEPPVMLLVAYGSSQSGMLQLHRPEVCYPAGGYQLTGFQDITVPIAGGMVDARFFTAAGPDRTEQLLYWSRIGTAFPRSWADQRLAVIRSNLSGYIPDGVLVRMSVVGEDPVAARAAMTRFANALVRSAPAIGRKLLLGPRTT